METEVQARSRMETLGIASWILEVYGCVLRARVEFRDLFIGLK